MSAVTTMRIPRSRQLYWGAIFILLMLASLIGLAAFLFSTDWLITARSLPIALHSGLRADYSADLRGLRPLAFNMALVAEAARDQQGGDQDPLPALAILLQTPVATVTPNPTGHTSKSTPVPASPTPTLPNQLSATPGLASSATHTATPTPSQTSSPAASATRRTDPPNPTAISPSQTPLPPIPTRRPPTSTQPPAVPTQPPSTPTRAPTQVPPTSPPPTSPPPTAYPAPATTVPTSIPYP